MKGVDIMPQATVNFRMDADLKKNMEKTCKRMGMNMTTAFTIFATQVCMEQKIPFTISADPFYSESNQRYLAESIKQLEAGKTVTKTLEELERMADE